jgi:hypothetical protein
VIALCSLRTETGPACGYPPGACPIHTRDSVPAPATSQEEQPDEKFNHESLRPIAESVITRLNGGTLKPLDAIRWLRALHTFYQLPVPALDEQEAWKEVELRGLIMHGQPPRNPEEWARAELVFDDEALAMFHDWEAKLNGWKDPADAWQDEDEDA